MRASNNQRTHDFIFFGRILYRSARPPNRPEHHQFSDPTHLMRIWASSTSVQLTLYSCIVCFNDARYFRLIKKALTRHMIWLIRLSLPSYSAPIFFFLAFSIELDTLYRITFNQHLAQFFEIDISEKNDDARMIKVKSSISVICLIFSSKMRKFQ